MAAVPPSHRLSYDHPAMLSRRRLLRTASASLLATPIVTEGQPAARVARVGFLAGSIPHPSPRTNAFVAGLRDFGYLEGQNVVVEWRATGGRAERLPEIAAELMTTA